MHRSTWKKGEARVAKMFDTKRTPLSGGNSGHTRSDTLSKELFLEIKHRKSYPQEKLWNKTLENSKLEKKVPAVIFIKKSHVDMLILCRLSDIKKIAELYRDENKEIPQENIPPSRGSLSDYNSPNVP